MFKLVFLGTSSSTPSVQRSLPSVALVREGEVFLFDCGEGTQRQMLKYGISYAKVRAIFLSHLHLDHTLGAFGLAETIKLNLREKIIDVYGPKGTSGLFHNRPQVRVHEFSGAQTIDMGDFTMQVAQNNHMPNNSFSFAACEKPKVRFHKDKAKFLGLKGPQFTEIKEKGKLKINGKTIKLKEITYVQEGRKITYSGDTSFCPALARLARGSHVLIHEATFSKEDALLAKEHMHSTSIDAAQAAKKSSSQLLLLTHISSRYPPNLLEEEAKAVFPNTTAAYDGFSLEVK